MNDLTTHHSPLHHSPKECWPASNRDERCRAREHSESLGRAARQMRRPPKGAMACRAYQPDFRLPQVPERKMGVLRSLPLRRSARCWDVAVERPRWLLSEIAPSFPADRTIPAIKSSQPPGDPVCAAGPYRLTPFRLDPTPPGFHSQE